MVTLFSDLRDIINDTRKSQSAAFAPGTMENLYIQWVKFLTFCISFGLPAFPASAAVLAWYAQYLSYSFKAHESIVNYLSGAKTLHNLLDVDTSGFSGFILKMTLRGLRRTNQYVTKQALAITPEILHQLYYTLDHNNGDDATFWAACLLMFFLLLRKSNAVADTLKSADSAKLLCRQDIEWNSESVFVTLRWSKTNQFGEHLTFSLPKIPGSILCPVRALRRMWGLRPSEVGWCFQREDGRPFTYYQFHNKLRQGLTKVGLDATLYSSHSMRRGGTTHCFLSGVPSELIRLLGSWSTDCYFRYLEFPLEARAAATELMKRRIQVLRW